MSSWKRDGPEGTDRCSRCVVKDACWYETGAVSFMKMAKREAFALRGRFDVISMQMQFLSDLSCRKAKFACIFHFQHLRIVFPKRDVYLYTYISPFFSLQFLEKIQARNRHCVIIKGNACMYRRKIEDKRNLFFLTISLLHFFLS